MPPKFTKKGTLQERFWQNVVKTDGCWLWKGNRAENGYGRIHHRHQTFSVHRLSWELHFGQIPDGMYVCHRCDVRHCVRPDHLFLGTPGDNVRDCWGKGRGATGTWTHPELVPKGEQNGMSKLSGPAVDDIRRRWATGESQTSLAREFGINQTTVSVIVRRKTWRHR